MPVPNRNIKKIVKLENGNNRLINTDGVVFATVPPSAAIMHVTQDNEKVYVRLQNDAQFYFNINTFSASQAFPNPESPFNGNITDLLELLDTSFFFIDSTGGGGNNIYNSNGTLTGNREVDADGNELIFTNFNRFEVSSGLEYFIETQIFEIDIPSADLAGKVLSLVNATTKEVEFTDASLLNNVLISATPPANTQKLWFNTNDKTVYFYDGSDWLSEQLYEVTFNDQGTTPNNTFLRIGNTVTNDLGIGFYLEDDCRVFELTYCRNPNTAASGNFWLYSNSLTGTDFANVIAVFNVSTAGRGVSSLRNLVDINSGSYISMRWNGTQTNNNIVSLKYRKKYV